MDWRLLVGSGITIGIAVAHSVLGERGILAPVLKANFSAASARREDFIRLTLRFAWHLTSLFMLGCVALIFVCAVSPINLASIFSLEILGALFILSAAITGSYPRGRHIAWPLFVIVGVLCWWAAVSHSGGILFYETQFVIGLAASVTLMLIGCVYLYWAIKGTGNRVAVIPEKDGKLIFQPSRLSTAAVVVGLVFASALVAGQATGYEFKLLPEIAHIMCWLFAVVFLARALGDFHYVGLFKKSHMTTFAYYDTAIYTPLCLLLGLSISVAAL